MQHNYYIPAYINNSYEPIFYSTVVPNNIVYPQQPFTQQYPYQQPIYKEMPQPIKIEVNSHQQQMDVENDSDDSEYTSASDSDSYESSSYYSSSDAQSEILDNELDNQDSTMKFTPTTTTSSNTTFLSEDSDEYQEEEMDIEETQSDNDIDSSEQSDSGECEYEYFAPNELKMLRKKRKDILKKIVEIEDSPFFVKFQEFLRQSKTFFPTIKSKNKFKINQDFNFDLGIYIDEQCINLDNKLVMKNFRRLNSIYSKEMGNLEFQTQTSMDMLKSINDLASFVRPVSNNEERVKKEDMKRRFQTLMAHQRANACDYLLEARRLSGESRPTKNGSKLKKSANGNRKGRHILPKEKSDMIIKWFQDNIEEPFPNDEEKVLLAARTNLSKSQVDYWFSNKRGRVRQVRINPKENLKTKKKETTKKKKKKNTTK